MLSDLLDHNADLDTFRRNLTLGDKDIYGARPVVDLIGSNTVGVPYRRRNCLYPAVQLILISARISFNLSDVLTIRTRSR